MDSFNVLSEIENLENEKLKQILQHLCSEITAKDHQIKTLQNKVPDLELRVTAGEKYSSKDCLILENMPVKDPMLPLSHQVCDFLKYFLNFDTDPCNFKACHYLGKSQSQLFPPAIIVKFVYFHEKAEILGRKSWLAGKSNSLNGKGIYIKERLPRVQKEIQAHADSLGLITTTYNCDVKVFKKDDNGFFKTVTVNSIKAVDDIQKCAILRMKRKQKNPADDKPPKTPHQSSSSNPKRVRESPGDFGAEEKSLRLTEASPKTNTSGV